MNANAVAKLHDEVQSLRTHDENQLSMTNPIRHADPKAQPYCAKCGRWIDDYPFAGTNLCEKCRDR